MPSTRQDQRDDAHCMSANSAVTLMKEAVDSAIKHGDIRLEAVCCSTPLTEQNSLAERAQVAKAVGMSKQHLREWIASR